MLAQGAVNFEDVVKAIRDYETDVMGGPVHIDRQDPIIDTMIDLMHEIEKRDYASAKCAYYMHPVTADSVFEEQIENNWVSHDMGENARVHGRPIRTHATIPQDVILFLAPDAISLGGKIYHPEIIAYAD